MNSLSMARIILAVPATDVKNFDKNLLFALVESYILAPISARQDGLREAGPSSIGGRSAPPVPSPPS